MTFYESELVEAIQQENIKNFNNNGGVNMYTYKLSEEDLEKASNSEKDTILEKIKEINAKYTLESYTPAERQTLGLETKEYTAPTKDEILQEAEESLSVDKESGLKNIEEKYTSKFSDLDEKAVSILEDKNEDVEKIYSDYDSSLKNARNDSIKQGISRSSIYSNVLKEIEGEKIADVVKVQGEYQSNIDKLESEKSILEQQKESALNSFDISYAVKLENKIASLNAAIAKEQDAVLKYNKDVIAKESAYQAQQEKAEIAEKARIDKKNEALTEMVEKKGATAIAQLKAQEKFDAFMNYLSSMSKAEALDEILNDPIYENELGPYYSLLYARTIKRED